MNTTREVRIDEMFKGKERVVEILKSPEQYAAELATHEAYVAALIEEGKVLLASIVSKPSKYEKVRIIFKEIKHLLDVSFLDDDSKMTFIVSPNFYESVNVGETAYALYHENLLIGISK